MACLQFSSLEVSISHASGVFDIAKIAESHSVEIQQASDAMQAESRKAEEANSKVEALFAQQKKTSDQLLEIQCVRKHGMLHCVESRFASGRTCREQATKAAGQMADYELRLNKLSETLGTLRTQSHNIGVAIKGKREDVDIAETSVKTAGEQLSALKSTAAQSSEYEDKLATFNARVVELQQNVNALVRDQSPCAVECLP